MQLGDIHISRIPEMVTPFMRPADMFPDAPPQAFEEHRHWLEPAALCRDTGKLIINIQSWLIRTSRHTILVDTCIGCDKTNHYFPEWHRRRDDTWLHRLLAAGIDPAAVDYVFCTHLHGDHCGWNTRLVDGRFVPTFTNARYIISKQELRHARHAGAPAWHESVQPLVEAGQLQEVDGDYQLDDQLWLEPTAGHTAGHVAVHLRSGAHRAVLCGDIIHSPIQCLYPHWHYWIDHDAALGAATRRRFLEQRAEDGHLVLTAHFPGSSAGYVEPAGQAFRFRFTPE